MNSYPRLVCIRVIKITVARGYPATWLRHIEKTQCVFPTYCFLAGFANVISRTPHQLISIDMKYFV